MRRLSPFAMAALLGVVAGCANTPARDGAIRAADAVGTAPRFDGMGRHQRKITTTSAAAQEYFNQGLVWTYAFNHDEAIRSFREAARLDPQAAMPWWGIAFCNGPHINNPTDEGRSREAWRAVQEALARRASASPVEQALIDAVAKRYADPPPADRRHLDEAFAGAMAEVYRAYPDDPDVGVLYAESMMDLQPWDMWTKDGQPKGRTLEVVAVLESVLKKNPDHPGACHLYIHAVEASQTPQRAAAAADRLRNAVLASGHLTHMPSHIDVRTGKWEQASEANELAIKGDVAYRRRSPKQGFYNMYMAHNRHFLAFSYMMEGRGEDAERAAREMVASIPPDFRRDSSAIVDGFTPIVTECLMRFGRWDDILTEPAPPENLPITIALWRFARAVAYAAKGELANAETEQTAFREAVGKVPPGAIMAINPASKVLEIAEHMLRGEIAYRRGAIDEAVSALRTAIAIEDSLQYMEPPDWVQPVRHTLGAVLIDAKRFAEAEAVYREDLHYWPENGWSLFGLAEALKGQGKATEEKEVRKRFKAAWKNADTEIGASCLCVKGEE